MPVKKPIIYNGQEYASMSEMCRKLHIRNRTTFAMRLKLGWTIDEAIRGVRPREYRPSTVKRQRPRKYPPINYRGMIYASMKSLCRKNRIDYKAFRLRVRSGWAVEEAARLGWQEKRGEKKYRRWW
jgi:hypothetical protein